MAHVLDETTEIRELARYEVRPEFLEECCRQEVRRHSLYPNCLAPVEFTAYRQVEANAAR